MFIHMLYREGNAAACDSTSDAATTRGVPSGGSLHMSALMVFESSTVKQGTSCDTCSKNIAKMHCKIDRYIPGKELLAHRMLAIKVRVDALNTLKMRQVDDGSELMH